MKNIISDRLTIFSGAILEADNKHCFLAAPNAQVRVLRACLFHLFKVFKILLHRFFDCAEDVFVAGTAAQVSGDKLTQLLPCIQLSAADNFYRRQNKAGGTEAALNRRFIDKGLLYRIEFSVFTL